MEGHKPPDQISEIFLRLEKTMGGGGGGRLALYNDCISSVSTGQIAIGSGQQRLHYLPTVIPFTTYKSPPNEDITPTMETNHNIHRHNKEN